MLMRLLAGGLLVAGVAAWLAQVNLPHHPLTVQLVEWQTALGLPLAPLCIGGGVLVLIIGSSIRAARGRPVADPPSRERTLARAASAGPSPSRPSSRGEPPAGEARVLPLTDETVSDWRHRVMLRASDLDLDPGASLRLDLAARAPFTVTIGDVPPGRARRAIATVAELVAEIPRPPEVVVRFDGFKEVGSSRKAVVTAAFTQHFAPTEFTIQPATDGGFAVVFSSPDPGWRDEIRPGDE